MILNLPIKNVKVLLILKNNSLLSSKNNSIIIREIKAIKTIKTIKLEMEDGEIKVALMGIMVDLEEIKEDLMEVLMGTLGILVVKVSTQIKLIIKHLHTMIIV